MRVFGDPVNEPLGDGGYVLRAALFSNAARKKRDRSYNHIIANELEIGNRAKQKASEIHELHARG
jgi:hypothetical protein